MEQRVVRAMIVLCGWLIALPSARAGEGLDLRAWIERPGVRLVAVEFYATWCKPCMEAVPRWRVLHERYREQGLRLIVVNTQDPEGACLNPGWNPDQMICDSEGDVARAMNVGSQLPSAFLWSWQGALLVRQGHIDEVERRIEEYLRSSPRVLAEAGGSPEDRALRDLLRQKLSDQGKLVVVAGEEEKKALRRLLVDSQRDVFDEKLACVIGREVSANSLLRAALTGKKPNRRLSLTLFSAESSCLLASASAPWSEGSPGRSAAEAVDKLLGKLRHGLQLPGQAAPGRDDGGSAGGRGQVEELAVPGAPVAAPQTPSPPHDSARTGFLFVESEPVGATVLIDGEERGRTPYQVELPAGSYLVACRQGALYHPASKRVELGEQGSRLRMVLEPDFGELEVGSDPPGAVVELDGEPTGSKTPVTFPPKKSGTYRVRVSLPRYLSAEQSVELGRGEKSRVQVKLQPNFGSLRITSTPTGAQIRLDGQPAGRQTPATLEQVEAGLHQVELQLPAHHPAQHRINLERGQQAQLDLELQPRLGTLSLTAVLVEGEKVTPAQARVRVAGRELSQPTPLKEQLLVGLHELRLQAPGAKELVLQTEVKEGETTRLEARLEPLAVAPAPKEPGPAGQGAAPVTLSSPEQLLAKLAPVRTPQAPARPTPSRSLVLPEATAYFPDYVLNHPTESPFEKYDLQFRIQGAYLKDFSESGIEQFLDEHFNSKTGMFGWGGRDLSLRDVRSFLQLVAGAAPTLAGAIFDLTDPELGLFEDDSLDAGRIGSGLTLRTNHPLPATDPTFVDVLELTLHPGP